MFARPLTEDDRGRFRMKFWAVVLPLIAGGAVPWFGFMNLFWQCVFGLPGSLYHWAEIPHLPQMDILWVLGWPVFILWIIAGVAGRVANADEKVRRRSVALYLLSLPILAPMDGVMTISTGENWAFEWLPLYVRQLVF
jgi:hypothetical protein